MKDTLIAIDLGTTGCRSAVIDKDINILGEAYIEYPLINLSETEIEQDANLWWELTKEVIKSSVSKSGIAPESIKGISISSQGIAFVPVDKDCNPLRNAISWLDTRPVEQMKQIKAQYSLEYIFKLTGKRASETYLLPKLMWVMQNEPEIYEKTYKILMPHDFILAKLCGSFVTDHTMASGTLLYDVTKQKWSDELIEKFGIDKVKLPEIRWSGTVAGVIKSDVAEEIGIGKDVVIAVGGQDQKCAALGAGIDTGIATVSLGTATAITRKWDHPAISPQMRIPCFSDLFKGNWVTEGVISTSCVSLKWFKQTFFDEKSYKDLDEMVEKNCTGASDVFFYPYLAGACTPNWYENPKGIFYGITLSTSDAGMVRSVMEGIAYQIKENLEFMETDEDPVNELRLFGGGSRSKIWCRIIADITGKKVVVPFTPETACAGAAILAGMGAGVYSDAEEAVEKISIKDTFCPDAKMKEVYENKYKEYVRMQEKILG